MPNAVLVVDMVRGFLEPGHITQILYAQVV